VFQAKCFVTTPVPWSLSVWHVSMFLLSKSPAAICIEEHAEYLNKKRHFGNYRARLYKMTSCNARDSCEM